MNNENHQYKTALITGVSGSGGSYLAEYLVNRQPYLKVHGISRWHSTASTSNLRMIIGKITMHECDLTDFSSVLSTLTAVRPDLIFHIASYANVRASFITPLAVVENNVMGTLNLLEAIRLAGIDPVIQLCSTSEVYGQVDQKNVPITEDCPINPSSPYAVSKLTQDCLGHAYFLSYGLKVVRTRMFAYINPRRADLFATAFALQAARIERGLQKVLLHGNLDSVRTLIDVRDAMESYWLAAVKGKPGEVYNIGGETTISVGEFLDILKQKARCNIPSILDPSLLRPADVTLQIPNVEKFTRLTGWKPKYSFEESVDLLLEQARSQAASEAMLNQG